MAWMQQFCMAKEHKVWYDIDVQDLLWYTVHCTTIEGTEGFVWYLVDGRFHTYGTVGGGKVWYGTRCMGEVWYGMYRESLA